MSHGTDEQIAQELLQRKFITQSQYDDAVRTHRDTGTRITKIIHSRNYTSDVNINTTLTSLECSTLDYYIIDTDLVEKFRYDKVKQHKVMPLFTAGQKVFVSMADPQNYEAQEMIEYSSGISLVRNIVSSEEEIDRIIQKFYGRRGAIIEAMKEVNSRRGGAAADERKYTPKTETSSDAPMVKLVDEYIHRAVNENASDIHFEPQEDGLRIRMRIDGQLHTIETIPTSLIGPLTSRIKIMAQMKIDQRMIPQDGRFSRDVDGLEVDFRISSFPGIFGESLALRLLKRKQRTPIPELGLAKTTLAQFKKVLNVDKGIFLVTGPTGCGKTTTLVSILHEIRDPSKKIITLENPVEYQIDGATQGQIHPQAGFTWAGGLRAILRHDPNIILVAEIRDTETASIAMEAGLTGHFVFSTLHTRNAPSTIVRLLEMGVEPFILSSSLVGVLAQRLVRVICPDCKEQYQPPPSILKAVGLKEIPKSFKLFMGKGCKMCRGTGYRGRIGIFELMLVDDPMRQMILDRATSKDIEAHARKNHMRSLREDGIRKALQGLTTLEEIMSVTQEASVT